MPFRLPSGEFATPLLRTDASQPEHWSSLLTAIATPNPDGFLAYVTILTDPELDWLDEDAIRRLPRDPRASSFVLVADQRAQVGPDFAILVVDVSEEALPSFRVSARCLWSVQNNLSLANLDWEDFSDNVEPDGVYRDC